MVLAFGTEEPGCQADHHDHDDADYETPTDARVSSAQDVLEIVPTRSPCCVMCDVYGLATIRG